MKYLRKMSKAISIAGAAALVCSSVTPALAASEEQFDQIAQPAATQYTSGQLVKADGEPVRAGVPVQVFAWPDSKRLAKLKVGESFKMTEVSSVKTDASGKFSLAPALREAAKSTVPMSVTVIATDGKTPYQYSTELSSASGDVSSPALLALKGSDPSVSLGAGSVVMKPSSDVNVNIPVGKMASTASVSTPAAYTCSTRLDRKVGTSYAQIGATFLYATGAKAQFTFKKGTSASLGVASSASGKKGTFNAGGTTSVTSDAEIAFAPRTGGIRFYKAQVESGKFSTVCQNMAGPGIRVSYQVRPIDFTGGTQNAKGTGFSENHRCVPFGKNMTFTKDKSRAITWNKGLTLPSIAGITVSSQSGFSTRTKVVYQAGKKNRKLCGHLDWPAKNAGSIKLK